MIGEVVIVIGDLCLMDLKSRGRWNRHECISEPSASEPNRIRGPLSLADDGHSLHVVLGHRDGGFALTLGWGGCVGGSDCTGSPAE